MSAYSEDRNLVARLLAGDEDAFELFFRTQAPRLYRFALSRLAGDADAAEEVVQRTLVRAVGKLATYRGRAALATWLTTFCRHELSARWRRNGGRPRLATLGGIRDLEEAADLATSRACDDPERRLLDGELGSLVRTVLDRLPERHGAALEWKYVAGLSVREIGDRLGIGTTAAQSLLARAREGFRRRFRSSCRELVPGTERRNAS